MIKHSTLICDGLASKRTPHYFSLQKLEFKRLAQISQLLNQICCIGEVLTIYQQENNDIGLLLICGGVGGRTTGGLNLPYPMQFTRSFHTI